MNQSQNIPAPASDDLLALIKAIRLMWKHKGWIALGTFLFTAPGILNALMAEPVYVSTAIIARQVIVPLT